MEGYHQRKQIAYEQVHKNNKEANIAKIDRERPEHFKTLATSLGL
jgi:hypothetical protein